MNKSESIKSLAGAMAKAQEEMPHVKMNSVNPFLKNKFADLGSVITTLKSILPKHGLSYSQMNYSEPGKIGVTTIIMHDSGEWIESSVALDMADEKGISNAQVAGKIITYLRRYSLTSAFGLFADEDTDGDTGITKKEQKPEKTESEKKQTAVEMYSKLVERAKAVNLNIPALDAGLSSEKMKAQYQEQYKFVQQAEAQAKAGE